MTKNYEKVCKKHDKMNALNLKKHCFSVGKTYFSINSAFPKMYPKNIKKHEKSIKNPCQKRSKNDAKPTCKKVMNFDAQK